MGSGIELAEVSQCPRQAAIRAGGQAPILGQGKSQGLSFERADWNRLSLCQG